MALDFNCISCNINQVIKVINLLNTSREQGEGIIREVLEYLSGVDYSKCNPEIMGGVWEIICESVKNNNPYKDIKTYYNLEMKRMYNEIKNIINESENEYITCLKIAVVGNIIDFAAGHDFNMDEIRKKIIDSKNIQLAVDDSDSLYKKMNGAKSILYLGDNCGEVVLDKIFIEFIRQKHPDVNIFYGVRGKPVVNDVCKEDAEMAGIHEIAKIIENGDGSLGTVMDKAAEDFRKIFYEVDMIISKGQGNYESLNNINRENIFFLFMSKCEPVSKGIGVEIMSIVCLEKK